MKIQKDIPVFWSMLFWGAFLLADGIIYLFLGLLQMSYDDHYSETKGIYGSWESMSENERTYHAAFLFWNLVNLIILALLVRKLIRKCFKKNQG